MARKSPSGRYILAAGEIGAFTVCPESWRLKYVERARTIRATTVDEGKLRHREWARDFEEASFLAHRVRLVIFLLMFASMTYIVMEVW